MQTKRQTKCIFFFVFWYRNAISLSQYDDMISMEQRGCPVRTRTKDGFLLSAQNISCSQVQNVRDSCSAPVCSLILTRTYQPANSVLLSQKTSASRAYQPRNQPANKLVICILYLIAKCDSAVTLYDQQITKRSNNILGSLLIKTCFLMVKVKPSRNIKQCILVTICRINNL